MLTRHRTSRIRLLAASLALATLTAFGAPGIVAAANPHRTFDVTACATPNDKNLVLTVSWSGMPVSAWSYFIESTEGSGGVLEPLPETMNTGTLTQTFPAEDVGNILSVSATVFRAAGPNYIELDSVTLTQPASGWPTC
jgi:hypothetical protein